MHGYVRRLAAVLSLACFMALSLAGAAFAQTAGATTAVNDAVSGAASSATGLITTNIPVILGVLGVSILLAFGLKMVKKVKGAF